MLFILLFVIGTWHFEIEKKPQWLSISYFFPLSTTTNVKDNNTSSVESVAKK